MAILMSGMFGFRIEPDEEHMTLITFAAINLFAYEAFTKYIYTPVETGKLVLAKLLVTARIIAVPVLLSQLVAISICVINPDNDGGSFANSTVWIPIINGVVYLIYDTIVYKLQCDVAMKK